MKKIIYAISAVAFWLCASSAQAQVTTIPCNQLPALTGDATTTAASCATTVSKINGVAAGALATVIPGTGVATALAINVGTAGAFITNGGALGSPLSIGVLPAFTYGGVTLSNAVTGTGAMALATSPVFQTSFSAHPGTNQNFFIQGPIGGVITTGVTFESLNDAFNAFLPVNMAASQFYFNQGGISIGTTTDPGNGGLIASAATIKFPALGNTATTSAVCYNTGTGLLTYDGTVGTCTVSDERLKNIGSRIDHALDKLLRINGFNYTWKDSTYGTGPQIGVGAQTVGKVFPELVSTGSDGVKSVDYQRLTAPIIEAMRELKANNDNLRACQQSWKCRIFGMQP